MGCPNEEAYLSGLTLCSRLQICAVDGRLIARSRAVTAFLRGFSILCRDLCAFGNGMAFTESSAAAVTDAFWVSAAAGASRPRITHQLPVRAA